MTYPDIVLLNKPAGLTPLQSIELFKIQYPGYKDEKLSYAGRLDPMAEGLLLILVNEENKKRHDYEHLPKVYEFEIMLRYSTDTYDVMGYITQDTRVEITPDLDKSIRKWVSSFVGEQKLCYPPYSSKFVDGHPLYWYAKRNSLHTVIIPEHIVTIESFSINSLQNYKAKELYKSIHHRLSVVKGNFRQEVILQQWEKILSHSNELFPLYKCTLSCQSGTYVRGIVNKLSEFVGVPMFTYSIKRLSIGSYSLSQSSVFSLT